MRLFAGSVNYRLMLYNSKHNLPFLLMMHGFMGSSRVFDHLIPMLTPFVNPVTIDLAGHGETQTPDNPSVFKTENQIKQIQSILNRLQFEELYLYGYSMGGRLAIQTATAHPEYFSGLILESAHCGLSSEKERRRRLETDQERAKNIIDDHRSFVDYWSNLPLFEKTPETYKKIYREISDGQNPKQMALSLTEFGSGVMPSVCSKLSGLNMPAHLVAGSQDHKYVSLMTQMNEQFTDSQLHIIENSGHRVHTDQPQELTDVISGAVQASNLNEH